MNNAEGRNEGQDTGHRTLDIRHSLATAILINDETYIDNPLTGFIKITVYRSSPKFNYNFYLTTF